jgi:DNA-dependent metalloprotease WSS1
MPIRTIGDLVDSTSSALSANSPPQVRVAAAEASARTAAATSASAGLLPFVCCHLPTLQHADQARAMLLRIAREFQPIIVRRQYNVLSISEMCCCGDGLDHEPSMAKQRRKRRIMDRNILGYNMTHYSGGHNRRPSSRIHIRLRHHADHNRFFDYEEVAGTLAHELAHCEFSKHDDKFFKLMDEILDEHAALLTSALRSHGAPMAAFAGSGKILGGPSSSATGPTDSTGVGLPAAAAAGTSWFGGHGNRLGGGGGGTANNNNDNSDPRLARGYKLGGDSTFSIYMTPAEAAVAAAEARRRQQQLRLRGDSWCNPCVVDFSDDADAVLVGDDDEEKKPAAKRKTVSNNQLLRGTTTTTKFIDLTSNDDDEESLLLDSKLPTKVDASQKPADYVVVDHGCEQRRQRLRQQQIQQWSCRRCTFANGPITLACAMCTAERNYRPSGDT